jgi:hypothetical protein
MVAGTVGTGSGGQVQQPAGAVADDLPIRVPRHPLLRLPDRQFSTAVRQRPAARRPPGLCCITDLFESGSGSSCVVGVLWRVSRSGSSWCR